MLIEYKNMVVNLKNILLFTKRESDVYEIEYHSNGIKNYFTFETEEKRDQAYEKIIESYRCQRLHVKLDEND